MWRSGTAWALSPHFTKPGHTTTSTPADCTWVYQPKKQGCDASLQDKSIVLSWIIYAGRGLCRSQPLHGTNSRDTYILSMGLYITFAL